MKMRVAAMIIRELTVMIMGLALASKGCAIAAQALHRLSTSVFDWAQR